MNAKQKKQALMQASESMQKAINLLIDAEVSLYEAGEDVYSTTVADARRWVIDIRVRVNGALSRSIKKRKAVK